jgi:3-oxoacyl-[acyl-carrier protein] reductase
MERVLRGGAFEGETHIVTGAAQGIGQCVAGALAAHGAQVTLVDLDEARLTEVRDEIAAAGAPTPLVAAANVTDEEQVKGAVASTLEASGCINGLVNVAGITREVAVQHWHPLFKENGNQPLSDGLNRFIVNFSSVSARNGNIGQIDYTAAKGAIESATKTTAREFSGYRVRVNAIAPGPVNTPMLAAVGEDGIAAMGRATLVGRIAEPEDMANVVCAIADPKIFGYTTGQIFAPNGGMYLD